MEARAEHGRIQLFGCKLLSSLGRGGAWEEVYSKSAVAALERTMCKHESDECVLYWALWAVQQLNGARALVVPMRGGTFASPSAMIAALQSLGAVSLGQSDGASAEDMPA